MFEQQIKQIKHVAIVSISYLFLIVAILMFVGEQKESKVLGPLVMLMGASGGVLNNYRRLQQLPAAGLKLPDPNNDPISNIDEVVESSESSSTENDPVASTEEVNTDKIAETPKARIIRKSRTVKSSLVAQTNKQQEEFISRLFTMRIYTSPIIGACFAYVIFLVFVGGLVQGSMFPEFQCIGVGTTVEELQSEDDYCHSYNNLHSFSQNVRPATNKDMAKLLIWGFIAGFAEGLIPSLLDNIAKEGLQQSREETKISEEKAPKNPA